MRPPRARLPPPALPTPAVLAASCPRMLGTPGSGRPRRRVLWRRPRASQLSARRDFRDNEGPTVARAAGGGDTSGGGPAMTITHVFPPRLPAVSTAREPGASLPSVQTRRRREEREQGLGSWHSEGNTKGNSVSGNPELKAQGLEMLSGVTCSCIRGSGVSPGSPPRGSRAAQVPPRTGFARGRLPRHGCCGFAGARLLQKRWVRPCWLETSVKAKLRSFGRESFFT